MTLMKKVGGSLHNSGKTMSNLIEVAYEPMFIVDALSVITAANDAAAELTGLAKHEILNTEFPNLFTDPERVKKAYREILARGSGKNFRLRLNSSNSTSLDVSLNGRVFKNDTGSVGGAFISIKNETLNSLAEEQTAHLAAIVTSSNDAIISISLDGIIRVWNKSAEKIFGYTAHEIIGQKIDMIIPEGLAEEEKSIVEKIKKGEVLEQYETFRKKKDGAIINVTVSFSPIKDQFGTIKGISKVARETTDQKKFEQELIEAKRNAEREKQVAEEAMEAKQRFLSNMSHEIRTPLNAIIGFTKVLLKTNLTTKQKEYLDAINVSGDALIVLINDILDLAKVDSGKMTFEQLPFRLYDSISSMLHLFETKLIKKKLQLIKDYDSKIPEVLVGDPVRLHQIILNLVSNAIKFTHEGKITFSVKLIEEDEEKAKIDFSVTDTGIGIPQHKLETIFDNFQQATNETSRVYGGTGLGLAIVKQLVVSQGGTIHVKSQEGKGSTFNFNLTFRKTKEPVPKKRQTEEIPLPEDSSDEVRVLVVEDVTLNQLLIKTLLEEFGFEPTIAANGKIAVEKLKERRYDLILMDLQMPEMNGYEATDHIRNKLKLDIPIVALTADVTTADVEKCRAMGMNDYMAKPVDEKILHNKILKYVDKPKFRKKVAETKPSQEPTNGERVTNLDYMREHTKGNAPVMKQMIRAYLLETPGLIGTMKQSIDNMDWDKLAEAAHSIIPTFAVVGINQEYEEVAKKIKEHAHNKEESAQINTLLNKIETVFNAAAKELEAELEKL
jgi:PAS domain S-box-containing protein